MPKAPLLDDAQVEEHLASLDGWRRRDDAIEKEFTFSDFGEALDFVQQVRAPADEQDHHPDVTIHWNHVTLTLWTHASGGLTERDFRLARTIDAMTGG